VVARSAAAVSTPETAAWSRPVSLAGGTVSERPLLINPHPVVVRRRRPRRRSRRTLLVVLCRPPPPPAAPPPPPVRVPAAPRDSSTNNWIALGILLLLLQPAFLFALAVATGLYVLFRIERTVGDELERH
jgi:hypothetical protein